jgi:hypothetical protein
MKNLIIVAAFLVSTYAFAGAQSAGLNKHSPQLNALGSAFKTHPNVVPKINPNDITMGYTGEDVYRITDPKITTA